MKLIVFVTRNKLIVHWYIKSMLIHHRYMIDMEITHWIQVNCWNSSRCPPGIGKLNNLSCFKAISPISHFAPLVAYSIIFVLCCIPPSVYLLQIMDYYYHCWIYFFVYLPFVLCNRIRYCRAHESNKDDFLLESPKAIWKGLLPYFHLLLGSMYGAAN